MVRRLAETLVGLALVSAVAGGSSELARAGHIPQDDARASAPTGHGPVIEGASGGEVAARRQAHWTAPEVAAQRSNPIPPTEASIERGEKIFESNCAVCHGGSGRGDGLAAVQLSRKPADLTVMIPMHPEGDIAWKIEHGRGPMPAWRNVLSEKEIWDVVNFLKYELAAGAEHEANETGHHARDHDSHVGG